jgi:hypothetical protein
VAIEMLEVRLHQVEYELEMARKKKREYKRLWQHEKECRIQKEDELVPSSPFNQSLADDLKLTPSCRYFWRNGSTNPSPFTTPRKPMCQSSSHVSRTPLQVDAFQIKESTENIEGFSITPKVSKAWSQILNSSVNFERDDSQNFGKLNDYLWRQNCTLRRLNTKLLREKEDTFCNQFLTQSPSDSLTHLATPPQRKNYNILALMLSFLLLLIIFPIFVRFFSGRPRFFG